MTRRINFKVQLQDAQGQAIVTSGGVAMVCVNGSPLKHTIYSDAEGTAASNPKALTRGMIEFWVLQSALTNDMVDLYIQAPGGQFLVARNLKQSGPNELTVDTDRAIHQYVIPFHITDYPAAVETDTGFDVPAANTAIVLPDAQGGTIRVTAIDATETLDVGTATAETGDPDGFMSAVSVGTLGIVADDGALLGTLAGHIADGKSIVMTSTAGSDTGQGYVYLTVELFN